jgi:predicted ester cyclase
VTSRAGTRSQASTATAVVQALLSGDVLTLQRLTHADVVDGNGGRGQPTGWAGLRERALTECASLPEGITVELVCSEGDAAVCRVRIPGTRRGFPESVSPGDRVTVLFVLRFRDGLVGELWSSSDLSPFRAVVAA